MNSLINCAGVVAVALGVWVANDTLDSIDKSVDVAEKQLKLSSDQFTAARDALWLDQRPWLAVSKSETVPDDVTEDSRGAAFRFHVLNSGKSPAFGVRLLQSNVDLRFDSISHLEPKLEPAPAATMSVFPGQTVQYSIAIKPKMFFEVRWPVYYSGGAHIAVSVRLQYCDANRSLHWTQLGVAKRFSETELTVQHSSASLHPGAPDHRDCQDEP